jgi:hypothetical protein
MLSAYPLLASGEWLRELGFRKRGPNLWSIDGLRLSADGRWLSLRSAPLRGDAANGPPGPWKLHRRSGRAQLSFDAPLAAIADRSAVDDGSAEPQDLARSLVQWAVETRPGHSRESWEPPEAARLQQIVPESALSFRAGTLIQPAHLARGDRSLSLRVALCRVQGELSSARRTWLERFLLDAEKLRMVRLEMCDGAVEASVDLGGAPANVLESVLAVALDVLRHAFVLLAPTASVLADARWRSEIGDRSPFYLNQRRSR